MKIWVRRWVLALMFTSLYALPSSGFEGGTQDVALDTVTCLNHTTGEVAVGVVTQSSFDCSALVADEDDVVGVVLLGTMSSDTDEVCTVPLPLEEVEPNGTRNEAQELPQPCVSIRGNVNSTDDLDAYRLHLPQPMQLRFELSLAQGASLEIIFFDGATVQRLGSCGEAGTQDRSCQGLFSPAIIDIVIFAEGNTGSYTLDITPIPDDNPPAAATYHRSATRGIR